MQSVQQGAAVGGSLAQQARHARYVFCALWLPHSAVAGQQAGHAGRQLALSWPGI